MFDIVICDRSTPASKDNIVKIKKQYPYAHTVRFWSTYLGTINRVIEQVKTSHFWFVSSDCDLSNWNFNWVPDAWERNQIHCWSNNNNKFGSVFLIPVDEFKKQQPEQLELFKDINYHQATFTKEKLDRFLCDSTADNLASDYTHIRNIGSFHNIVTRCCEQSTTDLFYLYLNHKQPMNWQYKNLPDSGWNQSTAYHFHTLGQRYGEVFIINKRKYLSASLSNFGDLDDIMYVEEDLVPVEYQAVVIEHNKPLEHEHPCSEHFTTSYIRFFANYLGTLKRLSKFNCSRLWVLSDLVDYTNFDWSYMVAPWEDKIDVWPSGNQLNGDTFLLNPAFMSALDRLESIHEWPHIDYKHNSVARYKWPVVEWSGDNLASIIKDTMLDADFVLFKHKEIDLDEVYEPSYWAESNIYDQGARGAHSLVPKQAKSLLEKQIYDYNFIVRTPNSKTIKYPQDVFFISYDEANADENYSKLLTQTSPKRVHGIEGMVPALKKCAEQSNTPWFWAVFGKTEIVDNFDWSFTPDFYKQPCNYVFLGYNPVLDYAYGHGGVILYNTEWVKTVENYDFDFTMSFELETVPIVSTVVNYNITPLTAWRTALREGYKLKYYLDKRPSKENEKVLQLWLTKDNGINGNWSKLGAGMGVEFYNRKLCTYKKLMDWAWMEQIFNELLAIGELPQHKPSNLVDILLTEIGMHGQ